MVNPTGSERPLNGRNHLVETGAAASASAFFRVLVVGDDAEIDDDIGNALWIWPHKLTHAQSVDDAVRLCGHLTPFALLVTVDNESSQKANPIPSLRRRLPSTPIIAVVPPRQARAPGVYLDQGADAVLRRDEAGRPTLFDLMVSVQRNEEKQSPETNQPYLRLPLPWRRSEMLGALLCDVSGEIVDVNSRMLSLLGYASRSDLVGKPVQQLLLADSNDWSDWAEVAGDTGRLICRKTNVKSADGQILWMKVEGFAAQHHPSYIQAVFLDQSELAIPV